MAPHLVLCLEDSSQWEYSLCAVFNGLRYIVRSGAHWRMMPNDLPPWSAVYQRARQWLQAGCFETMVNDLQVILRELADRPHLPLLED